MATHDDDCYEKMKKRSNSSSSNSSSTKSVPLGGSLLSDTMKGLFKGGGYLLGRHFNRKKEGASFGEEKDFSSYLNPRNDGLLLDGNKLHLSERDSMQNVCVMARIGAGKTSRYIIPNILQKARTKCSMVVNDPKGEVFENTSEHMRRSGYKVVVIDPENLERSSRFNPFTEARNEIEIEQIAEILIHSGSPRQGGKDEFWLNGATRFVSLFIKCLKNAGRDNPAYYNLHNLYYLFQNFGEDGQQLEEFMLRYVRNPDDALDNTLWNEWQGVLTGNKEGVQSFILNAITALRSLSNRNIAALTARSDIDLEDIRSEKTIIYMITPAQNTEYYGFLTSSSSAVSSMPACARCRTGGHCQSISSMMNLVTPRYPTLYQPLIPSEDTTSLYQSSCRASVSSAPAMDRSMPTQFRGASTPISPTLVPIRRLLNSLSR